MTSTALAPPPALDKLPIRVTGKVRAAIHAMVWDGLPRDKAAEVAGLKDNGFYKAFRKPAVKAHYLHELEVLRTSERARNIHRLVEIRDAANNMPAVQAIDRLERLDDVQGGARGAAHLPGFVIQIINQVSPDAKPLIHHAPVLMDDTEQR